MSTAVPFNQRSIYTIRATQFLQAGKVGDEATREKLAEIVGISVRPGDNRGKGYSSLNSAIRYCEKLGVVWRWIGASGVYRCLPAEGRVQVARSGINRARKAAKRSLTVSLSVDESKLTPEQRVQHKLNQAQAGAMEVMSDSRARKKIEQIPGFKEQAPDASAVFKLFQG